MVALLDEASAALGGAPGVLMGAEEWRQRGASSSFGCSDDCALAVAWLLMMWHGLLLLLLLLVLECRQRGAPLGGLVGAGANGTSALLLVG